MIISKDYSYGDNCLFDELSSYKERLHIALKAAKICVFEVNLSKQLYTFFENAEDIFGVSGETILNDVQPYSKLNPTEYQNAVLQYFSHPDDADVINEAFKSIFSGQSTTYVARMKAGNTKFIWCKIDVTPLMKNNIPIRMIGVITDISSIKSKTEFLEQQTKLDMFTHLYNKKCSQDMINNILDNFYDEKHGFILFDLDNFKNVNDTYGHAAGDEVLKSISKNLTKIFREIDIIGRFGGDEFLILVRDIPNEKFLISKLDELLKSNDNTYGTTKSIGVSLFPDHSRDFSGLFQKADIALYKSKQVKNTYTIFSP